MGRSFLSRSELDTHKLAQRFVEFIPTGTTVALSGTLGAGKTAFVQGVGIASGINRNSITSPTFVLCNEYVGTHSIYHLDAYRLVDSDEFLELGPEELYESKHYVFIEWAERVIHCLPREYITININIEGRDSRLFNVDSTDTLRHSVTTWMDSIINE